MRYNDVLQFMFIASSWARDWKPVCLILQIDKVIVEAFKMVNAEDTKTVKEDEFKKILTEILGSIMLQLEGNPISVSSNSVVHEPLGSSSTLLQPSSSETA